ncbi:MAG: 2-hydroxyglutaryl-CoA dehydratase [Clostridiales bacterium]|nr:2-hydroxyglutaryl-CoA dehydratase [Clostridiales bacterium]
MKITFPRIGDSHIYGRLFFHEIGIDIVIPAPNSTEGLERGSAKAPEDICLPFKIMIDNLLSAWEQGADTVVMPATMGPCRLGEYGELLAVVLRKQGCDYRWILLDALSAVGSKELLHRLGQVVEGSPCRKRQILSALSGTYSIIKNFEKLEAEVRMLSPYDCRRGASKSILRNCRRGLEKASDISNALEIIRESRRELKELDRDKERDPLRLLVTGEIYTQIDAFGNHHVEEILMDLGVSFEKSISIGWWIRNTILNPFGGMLSEAKKNPLMPHRIGGYAKETVNEALRWKKEGFDGIVQMFPVGCMPEIVAKSVFDGLAKDEGLPVLTIVFDEMGGEAGYLTRIEAFVDMLYRKREMNDVLSGNRCGVCKH